MSKVVGIHGIGQQRTGGPQLRGGWEDAIETGLGIAIQRGLVAAEERDATARVRGNVKMVTFGDLYRPAGPFPPTYDLADLQSRDEKEFVEVLHNGAVEVEPELAPPEDALGGLPRSIQVMARTLLRSRAFAGFAELGAGMFAGNVKQALNYMKQDDERERVHVRVDAEVTEDTRVLIGHSMGSLVAYQYLAEGRAPQVELLVTMGSPLGIPNIIFDRLTPQPIDGRGSWPGATKRWVNFADMGDYVALKKKLGPLFNPREPEGTTIIDVLVDNGDEQHEASRYLNTVEMGQVLAGYL